MANVQNTEVRRINVGGYSMIVLAIFLRAPYGTIKGSEIVELFRSVPGYAFSGYSAINVDYIGYDGELTNFTARGNNLVITQDVQYPIGTQASQIVDRYIKTGDYYLTFNGNSYGYEGGDPWVEFSPAFMCVDADTKKVLVYQGGGTPGISYYFNNTNENIGVGSTGNAGGYGMLMFANLPVRGNLDLGFTVAPSDLNYEDVTEEVPELDTDPYNDPTRGEGDFDDGSSDNVNTPSLPTLSVSDTGFITLFNPSKAQLKSLANYLWSDAFSLDTFKKIFANPMSAILGLSILPIPVPAEGSRAVSVGNISTNVSMPVISKQFIEVNCGSVTLKRQRPGTYLDFSPYTKVDLYLPFIGVHPLNVDEVMGKSINIKYHVDLLSGACTAFVQSGDSILYQFIGQCAISVPITGNDWTNAINGVLNIAGSIGSMVLSGGATAPMAATSIASSVTNNLKPTVEKSGSISGAGGLLGVKRPYLIISRPNRNVAENQNKFIGYPTFKNKKMNNLDGYNSIESVHLDGIPATADEIREIETLLKGGVIF